MKTIFVDGYNVINSWPKLNKIKDYSFESARKQLIDELQNYAVYKGDKIFLVFDAHLVHGSLEKQENINDITVVFTKEGETADSFIERTVDNLGRKVDICVVTSDSLEQQTVFERGATRMSSKEFYFEVKGIQSKIQNITKKNYSDKKCYLEDRISKENLEKLEKIRRSR